MPAPAPRRSDPARIERLGDGAKGFRARLLDFGDDGQDIAGGAIGFGLDRCDRFAARSLDIPLRAAASADLVRPEVKARSFSRTRRSGARRKLNSDCPNSRKRQKARWISYGLRLRIYFCRALTVSAGEATMVLRRLALDPTVRIAVAVIATAPTLPIAQLGRVVTPVRKVTIPGVPFADGAHLASGALPRIRRLRVARRKAISCPAPGPRATRRSEPAPSGQPKWRCPQVRRVRRA